jgi:hypothetical protein
MEGQPDLFTRMNVKQLGQDGLSATLSGDALTLAPLAHKALNRLSWMGGTKSIPLEPFQPTKHRRYPVGGPVIDYENEPWVPIGPYAYRRI